MNDHIIYLTNINALARFNFKVNVSIRYLIIYNKVQIL